jgi:DNA-binding beta-propeller fold protein YncE
MACAASSTCTSGACVPASPWTSVLPVATGSIGFGDLAFLPGGDILAASSTSIQRVRRSDGMVSPYATGIPGIYTLGVTYRPADGMVYVSNNTGPVFRVTAAGVVSMLTDLSRRVHSLTIAPPTFGTHGGKIIATVQDGRVVAIDPAGPVVTTVGTTTGSLSDAAFAPDGTLYLVNYTAESVQTMTAAGTFSTFVATGLSNPDCIAIDPAGTRLWVINSGSNDMVEVTIPGAAVRSIASFGVNLGDNVTGMLHDGGTTLIHRTSGGNLVALTPP